MVRCRVLRHQKLRLMWFTDGSATSRANASTQKIVTLLEVIRPATRRSRVWEQSRRTEQRTSSERYRNYSSNAEIEARSGSHFCRSELRCQRRTFPPITRKSGVGPKSGALIRLR